MSENITQQRSKEVKVCVELQKKYINNLATANTEIDIFKYFLLVNIATCDKYITQTRQQAQESFKLSQNIAIAGFVLMVIGIILGVTSQLKIFEQMQPIQIAYVSTAAGLITEFIAGICFFLYNRTIEQVNRFHDQLQVSQKIVTGLLLNSFIEDSNKRYEDRSKIFSMIFATISHDHPMNTDVASEKEN